MTVEYFPVMRLEPPQLETPVLPPAEPVVPEKERRREPRFPCTGTAEIEIPHAGLRIRGQILDLSHSGCFIAAPSITLERGTQVEVLFETHQISIRVRGNILSLRPHAGVGIAFLAVSPRIARQIDALVDELAAAPDSPECDDAA